MQVVKRDGKYQEYDIQKIIDAIYKACKEVGEVSTSNSVFVATSLANKINYLLEKKYKTTGMVCVEDIQDLAERELMCAGYIDTARAYIKYRYDHQLAREGKLLDRVAEKLLGKAVENSNANLDEKSFGGRTGEVASEVLKRYALDNCMPADMREDHINNLIYIHDLNSFAVGMHNCLTIPFDKLFEKGFTTRQADVRPPKSVATAFQLLAVIFQLQSLQQFGGVSAGHLDWTMVPYVRMSYYKHYKQLWKFLNPEEDFLVENPRETSIDSELYSPNPDNSELTKSEIQLRLKVAKGARDLLEKEVLQAVEGCYHNLNTLQSRSGNQLPFTSINFGTCTLEEGRLVSDALLEGCMSGTGLFHKTSIFPCVIFQVMKGVNKEKGTKNYDLYQKALKCTAQRLYPNYVNVDWVNGGAFPGDIDSYPSSMGCRTNNGYDINGMGPDRDGRGNICPATIILPEIAMKAKKHCERHKNANLEKTFLKFLNVYLTKCIQGLRYRFNYIASQSPASARFMWDNGTMEGFDGKNIRSALRHGTLAVGYLGLAETLQILVGCNQTKPKGMELAKKILELYRNRCNGAKKMYHLNFGVYATPAESTCYTAMSKFREHWGIIPNVSDNSYFTNSHHVPVWEKVTPFEKIDIESQLSQYTSAGCITYVELDSTAKHNIQALETLVNYAMDKEIPYFAINLPNDTCNKCGYQDEIGSRCPQCGSTDISRLRRVTGYLTGDYRQSFNAGKQAEVKDRFIHTSSKVESIYDKDKNSWREESIKVQNLTEGSPSAKGKSQQ